MKGAPVRVGIVGSQFQAECHAASIATIEGDMTVVAVASPTPGNAEKLAESIRFRSVFTDYREMLKEPDIEMVTITAPNALHAQMTIDIAHAPANTSSAKNRCA